MLSLVLFVFFSLKAFTAFTVSAYLLSAYLLWVLCRLKGLLSAYLLWVVSLKRRKMVDFSLKISGSLCCKISKIIVRNFFMTTISCDFFVF